MPNFSSRFCFKVSNQACRGENFGWGYSNCRLTISGSCSWLIGNALDSARNGQRFFFAYKKIRNDRNSREKVPDCAELSICRTNRLNDDCLKTYKRTLIVTNDFLSNSITWKSEFDRIIVVLILDVSIQCESTLFPQILYFIGMTSAFVLYSTITETKTKSMRPNFGRRLVITMDLFMEFDRGRTLSSISTLW